MGIIRKRDKRYGLWAKNYGLDSYLVNPFDFAQGKLISVKWKTTSGSLPPACRNQREYRTL